MRIIFLNNIRICVFFLSISAAFAELPVFNHYPVTNNSMDDLAGKRFYCNRSFEDVFKNHNLTASLSPANNAGDT
ncbi:hypothetical protein [Endozoicomonas sp. ALB032]|uniref:hypothetical protein n=1 Tax=Endozoicomonas sp. ALB032 TaxID=3403082 RepID=UPI003BB6CD4B